MLGPVHRIPAQGWPDASNEILEDHHFEYVEWWSYLRGSTRAEAITALLDKAFDLAINWETPDPNDPWKGLTGEATEEDIKAADDYLYTPQMQAWIDTLHRDAARIVHRGIKWLWEHNSIRFERQSISSVFRTEVMERDAYRCVLCNGHRQLTVDHVIPVSAGGPTTLENLRTLCAPCNIRKGGRL
jgi:hypothetical protein